MFEYSAVELSQVHQFQPETANRRISFFVTISSDVGHHNVRYTAAHAC